MKKFYISLLSVLSIAPATNALTLMNVEQADGTVVKYKVDEVKQVTFADLDEEQGVSVTGYVGDYTYVDLGLESGTKWATYNVGAAKPIEGGNLYGWAETTTEATGSKYGKYIDNDELISKYNLDPDFGTVDNLTVLESSDDAATANWGELWRMPTATEMQELLDGCDWEYTDDYKGTGVAGEIGTSKSNGNTVFLPTALDESGTPYGGYWTASLSKETGFGNDLADYLLFMNSISINISYMSRSVAYSVRAVAK